MCKIESLSGFWRVWQAYVGPKPETPRREYWLPQLSILLLPFLWALTVSLCFLLFLFVISALLFLFWTPSDKSWLSRMQGSVVPIFAFSYCYDLLSLKSGFQSRFPSFCCCLCCTSNYLLTSLCFMVFKHTPVIVFSSSVPYNWNALLYLWIQHFVLNKSLKKTNKKTYVYLCFWCVQDFSSKYLFKVVSFFFLLI